MTDELDDETTETTKTDTGEDTTDTPSDTTTTPQEPPAGDEPMREHNDPVVPPIWERNREAAKYRHRAKTAEQQRDVALRKLANALRQIVASTKQLDAIDPTAKDDAIEALGDLSEFFDEDGNLDGQKLSEAITQLLEKKPYMERRYAMTVPDPSFSAGRGGSFKADRRDPLTAALLKRR